MVGQEGMTVCLQQYMHDFEWDAADSLKAYVAYRHPVNGQRIINVKMNPAICFGAPLVGDTGYTAETLWRAALAEGSEQKTAEYYEVEREAVVAACRYCEEIRLAA
jgi:uncharacterized protein (DUF433 family)